MIIKSYKMGYTMVCDDIIVDWIKQLHVNLKT